ncbi:MAG: hypothetical protein WC347_01035 [Smithellaceae bacterium]
MDVKYVISVDDQGGVKAVKDFDEAIDGIEKSSKEADTSLGKMIGGIAAGVTIFAAAKKAGDLLVGFFKDSVTAAAESEDAEKRLESALDSTGRTVSYMLPILEDFATQQQNITRYSDEQVMSVETLLTQLTNLDTEGIQRATKGAIGLASVLKIDLESAGSMVQKAIEGNTGALGRYGIKIDENLTKEQQRTELFKILEGFYGRAISDTDSFSGKLAQLNNKWDDVKEKAGAALLKGLQPFMDALSDPETIQGITDAATAIAKVAVAILDTGRFIAGISGHLKDFLNDLADGATKAEDYSYYTSKWRDATDDFTDSIKKATPPTKEASKAVNEHGNHVSVAAKETKTYNGELKALISTLDVLPSKQKPVIEGFSNIKLDLTAGVKESLSYSKAMEGMGTQTEETGKKSERTWGKTLEATKAAVSAIDAAISQSYTNKAIQMDNDYQKQLENIKSSTMSEEEKQKAITALEAEYELKRRKLAKEQAEAQKATSIVTAIINTAEGVTKALAGAIPPWNIILAGITAAAGAIQIAAIRSAPIPLARGAIFREPTLLAGMNGRQYQVGDVPGDSEIVASPTAIREAIFGKGGRSGRQIILQNHIYIDGREMKRFTVKTIEDAGQTGNFRLAGKAIA